jgi:DNA replication protein DnaC
MSDLVSRLKSLYADFGSIDAERQSNFSERLCDESLLVIDEIHECDEMRVKDRVLTDIVDKRYARRRDTILISNQTVDDFRHTANDSVLSRLTEHGGIFLCDWRSFRTKRQEADGEGAGLAVANR